MMGGLCFMVDSKMCIGVDIDKITGGSRVMARIGEDQYAYALEKKGCSEFNITGKAMKGFVLVTDEVIDMQKDLEYWGQLCLDFNPLAKLSKKKSKAKIRN